MKPVAIETEIAKELRDRNHCPTVNRPDKYGQACGRQRDAGGSRGYAWAAVVRDGCKWRLKCGQKGGQKCGQMWVEWTIWRREEDIGYIYV